MADPAEIIARNFRAFRKRAGLSQAEMAARAGVAQGFISKRETMTEGYDALRATAAVIEANGGDAADLLQSEGEPRTPDEIELVDLYSRTDPDGRALVLAILRREADRRRADSDDGEKRSTTAASK